MRNVWTILLWIMFSAALFAQSPTPATMPVTGYCNLGGSHAGVSGLKSTNYLQGIIPGCTVSVYLHGTQTLANPIYADSNNTPLNNPFTANVAGSPDSGAWIFWAAVNQGYDVVGSGGVAPNNYPAPITLTEVYLGGGGGGGGSNCPAGAVNDVQLYGSAGNCNSDTGVFTENPSTQTVSDTIVQATQEVDVLGSSAGQVALGASALGPSIPAGTVAIAAPAISSTGVRYILPGVVGVDGQFIEQVSHSGTDVTLGYGSGGGGGGVTGVTGTAPIAATAGTAPVISIQNATPADITASFGTDTGIWSGATSSPVAGEIMAVSSNLGEVNTNIQALSIVQASTSSPPASGSISAFGTTAQTDNFIQAATAAQIAAPFTPSGVLCYLYAGSGGEGCAASTSFGTVTHTGNLTLDHLVLGNGTADVKVDSAAFSDGTGHITVAGMTDLALGPAGPYCLHATAGLVSATATDCGGGGGGGVTGVTGTAPIASTGGLAPVISIQNETPADITSGAFGTDTGIWSGATSGTPTSGQITALDANLGITNTSINENLLILAGLPYVGTNDIAKFSGGSGPYYIQNAGAADIAAPFTPSGVLCFLYAGSGGEGCAAAGSHGLGTVTTLSVGNLSPLFTSNVATASTTPAVTFALDNFSADSILGNFTGSPAAPNTQAIPTCPNDGMHALVYVTHVLTCVTLTSVGGTVQPGAQYLLPFYVNPTTNSIVGPSNIYTDSSKNNLNVPGKTTSGTFGTLLSKNFDTELHADQWCTTPGTLDDTCITNAIFALPANGGRVVLSAGTYALASTVTVMAPKRVQIVGQGSSVGTQAPHGTGAHGSTYITWTGSSGGTMFKLTATTSAILDFSSITDMDIDCGSSAGVGIMEVSTWNTSIRNVHVSLCNIANIEMTTINGTGGSIDGSGSYLNANKSDVVDNVYLEESGSSGIGLWLTGTTADAGFPNTNYSFFHDIIAFYSNAPCIKVSTGDSNLFTGITCFFQSPGTATSGILLDGSQTGAVTTQNIFYNPDPSVKGMTQQSGANRTIVYGYITSNGTPLPTGGVMGSIGDGIQLGPAGILSHPSAPTIASGCGSSGDSIVSGNGTLAFGIHIGTNGTDTTCTLNMPIAAPHNWVCTCSDNSTQSSTVFLCRQGLGGGTNQAIMANYNTAGALAPWASGDILNVSCWGR